MAFGPARIDWNAVDWQRYRDVSTRDVARELGFSYTYTQRQRRIADGRWHPLATSYANTTMLRDPNFSWEHIQHLTDKQIAKRYGLAKSTVVNIRVARFGKKRKYMRHNRRYIVNLILSRATPRSALKFGVIYDHVVNSWGSITTRTVLRILASLVSRGRLVHSAAGYRKAK